MVNVGKNLLLLGVTLLVCMYLGEFLLGFSLTKSVLHYPLPAHSTQRHRTVDYDARYVYNNYSLRGTDFYPGVVYDAVLLGDSFFFGQGVGEGKTFGDRMEQKGFKIANVSEIATNPIDYFHKFNVMLALGLRSRWVIVGLCMGNDFQDIAAKDIHAALAYSYPIDFLTYDTWSFLRMERIRYQLRCRFVQLSDVMQNRTSGRGRETVAVNEFEHRRRFDEDWLKFFAENKPEIMKNMAGSVERPLSTERLTEAEYLQKLQLNDASLANTVKILNAITGKSSAAEVLVVLIPGPHYVWGFRGPAYNSYVNRLQENLDRRITVVDLHERMKPDMHYLHDGHWNEKGHEFIAALLTGYVSTR